MTEFSRHNLIFVSLALLVSVTLVTPSYAVTSSVINMISIFSISDSETSVDKFKALKQKTDAMAPWAAYNLVTDSVPGDIGEQLRNDYRKLAISLAIKAAQQNSPEALALILRRDDVEEFQEIRPLLVDRVLCLADKSVGKKEDAEILLLAADILQTGRLVVQDSLRAASYYARAWLAGSDNAPYKLSSLFSSLKDPASAYLWALRCTGKCSRPINGAETELLTPRQIQWIQAQARNRSVITVNGLAMMKEEK